ncbi:MAG: peptidoglycan bridge formation glycyltransferase FemA/FemB family protein, partial [Holdemanella sp.]|nr:peptidoglycan bridge formation glycyltransferase FemA/FemB family protein [Holdemanella sp.]
MSIQTIDKHIYEQHVQAFPYCYFLQSTYAADKMMHNGWTCEYVGYFVNGDMLGCALLAYLPLMKVYKYAYIPRGMVLNYFDKELVQSFIKELKDYLKPKKVIYLEIDPGIPYKERDIDGNLVEGGFDNSKVIENLTSAGFHHLPMTQGYDMTKQCRWVSMIPLQNKTSDDIFAKFSYMTRQDIRTSKKYGIKVRELTVDELYILDEMEKKTGQRHDFEAMSMDYYKQLYQFYPGCIKTMYSYLDLEEYGSKIVSELNKLEKDIQSTKAFLENNPNSIKKQKRLKTDEEYHISLLKK